MPEMPERKYVGFDDLRTPFDFCADGGAYTIYDELDSAGTMPLSDEVRHWITWETLQELMSQRGVYAAVLSPAGYAPALSPAGYAPALSPAGYAPALTIFSDPKAHYILNAVGCIVPARSLLGVKHEKIWKLSNKKKTVFSYNRADLLKCPLVQWLAGF